MTGRQDELVELVSDLVRIDARNPWLIDGGAGEAAIAADLADRARSHPRSGGPCRRRPARAAPTSSSACQAAVADRASA